MSQYHKPQWITLGGYTLDSGKKYRFEEVKNGSLLNFEGVFEYADTTPGLHTVLNFTKVYQGPTFFGTVEFFDLNIRDVTPMNMTSLQVPNAGLASGGVTSPISVNGINLVPGNRYEVEFGRLHSMNRFEGTFENHNSTHLKFLNVVWSGNSFSDYFIPTADLMAARDISQTSPSPKSTGKQSAVVTRTGARLEVGKEYYVTTNDGTVDFVGRFDNADGGRGTTSCVFIFDDVEFSTGNKLGNYEVLEEYVVTAIEKVTAAPGLLAFRGFNINRAPTQGNSQHNAIRRFQEQVNATASMTLQLQKQSCSCSMRDLSMNGCNCGAYESEMREKYGPEWKKPHWR